MKAIVMMTAVTAALALSPLTQAAAGSAPADQAARAASAVATSAGATATQKAIDTTVQLDARSRQLQENAGAETADGEPEADRPSE